MDRTARRPLAVHAASTLLAAVVVAAIAAEASRGNAAAVADTVAHTVVVPLSRIDFGASDAYEDVGVLQEIDAFVEAGVVYRVKVWEVVGGEAVVRYSDEPRIIGNRGPFDADLAARLKAGEVVVMEVPDDAEHRFEQGTPSLLEAFVGFRDAAGRIQDLASVGLALDRLGMGAIGDEEGALLTRATDLVDADLAQLRTLLTELAPPEFEGSLEAALLDLVDDLGAGEARITLDAGAVVVDREVAALLYRVTRELLRNAIEHGRPTTVRVALGMDGACAVLEVADDGGGFDPTTPAPEGHLGLRLIRQALLDSGGTVRVTTDPGGTRVRVRVPAESLVST